MNCLSLATIAFALVTGGCETVKPYEKEYLLDDLMSDQTVSNLQSNIMNAASARYEKLALGNSGGGAGSSCPTCGG